MTKRKRRLKKKPLLFVLLIIISFITFYYTQFYDKNSTRKENNSTIKNINNNHNSEIKKEKEYKISLLATGDGLIHSVIFRTYEVANGTYDFSGALTHVKDIVSKHDIAYYNQETPLGDNSLDYTGYPRFYTPGEFTTAMMNAGFNTLSLASNHSIDRGEKGVLNTLKYLKDTDFLYHGMSSSEEERNIYNIKEKNNITYTLLSYTEMTNGLSVPSGKDYLVNVYDEEQVKKDIAEVRDKVDILIVAMHWGVEYQSSPNDKQKEMAQYLADLGVDIIIGNHPHVLQPITWIDDTLVMYSLGNFISNQYGTDDYNKLVGFMATLEITKTVKDSNTDIKIHNLGGELIFTHYVGNPTTTAIHTNHKVIPFSIMTDETYLKDYQRIYTKYSQILNNMGANLNITPLPN